MRRLLLSFAVLFVLVGLKVQGAVSLAQEPKATLQVEGWELYGLAFSPDGRTLAVCNNRSVELWEVSTGRRRAVIRGHQISAIAYSPDSKVLALVSEKTIKLWHLFTNEITVICRGHTERVECVTFSPDGRILASGSVDENIRLWDVDTGRTTVVLNGHTSRVAHLAFSPTGKCLLSAGADGIRLWEMGTGKETASFQQVGRPIRALVFCPEGQVLVWGGQVGATWLWDATGTKQARTFELSADDGPFIVRCLIFGCDGKLGAWGGNRLERPVPPGEVWIWEVRSAKRVAILKGCSRIVQAMAISRDGKLLAVGGDDGTVQLWDLSTVLASGK